MREQDSCRIGSTYRVITDHLMTIISIAEGLPDEAQTTMRLLRNPGDIAAVFRPLYGNSVADRLSDLIKEHLVIAADLLI